MSLVTGMIDVMSDWKYLSLFVYASMCEKTDPYMFTGIYMELAVLCPNVSHGIVMASTFVLSSLLISLQIEVDDPVGNIL